jgi:threonine dehydrogenase-like Zn-dependent dehydrogenase
MVECVSFGMWRSLLVEQLGRCPTPTTWQASGGDRHLKFYEVRDNLLVFSEAYLTGIIGYLGDHPATIGLLAERLIDVGFYITKRIPLDDLVTSGFQELIQNKDQHEKILVQP